MKVKWKDSKSIYQVVPADNGRYDLVVVEKNEVGVEPVGYVYKNYGKMEDMERYVRGGSVVRMDNPVSLKLEVDASPLTKALADAKELEATLLRIKALLA